MPQEPRLGCGAAIVQNGKLLLIQRRLDPESGCWGLPGGKVDWLEPVEHAARRETQEELGISLGELTLLCVVDLIVPGKAQHWVAPVFLARQFEGSPRLAEPEKHAAWGWFALDNPPAPLAASARAALSHLIPRTGPA